MGLPEILSETSRTFSGGTLSRILGAIPSGIPGEALRCNTGRTPGKVLEEILKKFSEEL